MQNDKLKHFFELVVQGFFGILPIAVLQVYAKYMKSETKKRGSFLLNS